jgi:hypothetical protein
MFLPASNSLRMLKICVSVNRFFFMSNSLKLKDFRLILNCPIFGGAYRVDTGGEAKVRIDNQEVKVNGVVETQRRKKIRRGDIVTYGANEAQAT